MFPNKNSLCIYFILFSVILLIKITCEEKNSCKKSDNPDKNCQIKLENNKESSKKVMIIGIGGISRSGKTTLRNYLEQKLKPVGIFHIDDYGYGPIRKYDENIEDFIDDWEAPEAHNLDKFYLDLKNLKNEIEQNSTQEIKYIIAEGFLLYNRKDITDLIDLKFNFYIDKELARERRKSTKFYHSDYYFNEYIWKLFYINK